MTYLVKYLQSKHEELSVILSSTHMKTHVAMWQGRPVITGLRKLRQEDSWVMLDSQSS